VHRRAEREREGGRREAIGRQGRGREAREGSVHSHKLNVGMAVSLGMPVSLQAMVMLRGPRGLIHEYRL